MNKARRDTYHAFETRRTRVYTSKESVKDLDYVIGAIYSIALGLLQDQNEAWEAAYDTFGGSIAIVG